MTQSHNSAHTSRQFAYNSRCFAFVRRNTQVASRAASQSRLTTSRPSIIVNSPRHPPKKLEIRTKGCFLPTATPGLNWTGGGLACRRPKKVLRQMYHFHARLLHARTTAGVYGFIQIKGNIREMCDPPLQPRPLSPSPEQNIFDPKESSKEGQQRSDV